MRRSAILTVSLACILFVGCAEWVSVATYPPGAAVLVDGKDVGFSPVEVPMPRERLDDPPTYRVQLEGYRAVEGQFQTGVAPGRIVGTVFTFGILYAFRTPRYFVPVQIGLEPVAKSPVGGGESAATIEERLLKLRELHQRGLITDEEYQRYRDEAIRGM